MSDESELVRIRARGAPHRCPFCHDDVDHEREPWVACRTCLARHHEGCWTEGRGCADCGGALALAGPRLPETTGLPGLTVALALGREQTGRPDASGPVLVRAGRNEPFALVVQNLTGAAQHVVLRDLPSWLRLEGPEAVEAPARGEARLRLVVVADALPAGATDLGPDAPGARSFAAIRGAAAGTFTVSADDAAATVEVCVWRELSRARLVPIGLVAGVWPWPPGALVAVGWALVALPLAYLRRSGGDDLDAAFRERVFAANVRAALVVMPLAVAVTILAILAIARASP